MADGWDRDLSTEITLARIVRMVRLSMHLSCRSFWLFVMDRLCETTETYIIVQRPRRFTKTVLVQCD